MERLKHLESLDTYGSIYGWSSQWRFAWQLICTHTHSGWGRWGDPRCFLLLNCPRWCSGTDPRTRTAYWRWRGEVCLPPVSHPHHTENSGGRNIAGLIPADTTSSCTVAEENSFNWKWCCFLFHLLFSLVSFLNCRFFEIYFKYCNAWNIILWKRICFNYYFKNLWVMLNSC